MFVAWLRPSLCMAVAWYIVKTERARACWLAGVLSPYGGRLDMSSQAILSRSIKTIPRADVIEVDRHYSCIVMGNRRLADVNRCHDCQ